MFFFAMICLTFFARKICLRARKSSLEDMKVKKPIIVHEISMRLLLKDNRQQKFHCLDHCFIKFSLVEEAI